MTAPADSGKLSALAAPVSRFEFYAVLAIALGARAIPAAVAFLRGGWP